MTNGSKREEKRMPKPESNEGAGAERLKGADPRGVPQLSLLRYLYENQGGRQ